LEGPHMHKIQDPHMQTTIKGMPWSLGLRTSEEGLEIDSKHILRSTCPFTNSEGPVL